MTKLQHIITAGAAVVLLSCNTAGRLGRVDVETDSLYGDISVSDTATMAELSWTEVFTDSVLQDLIREGLEKNADLQIATQRVLAAGASFRQGRAALFPSLTAQVGGGYVRNSKILYPNGPEEIEDYQLTLQSSWEIDIWGKLNAAKKSAYANLLSTDAGKKAVQTGLVAGIANTYYALLALDEQLAITRQTVQTTIEIVETMRVLKENATVTGAAVVQSEALRYAAEASIPDLEQTIRETENALCLLLGRPAGKIERSVLAEQTSRGILQTGVPAQLLENRPDVMQAEYNLISAWELTRSARRYFYPSLTITATGGLESTSLDKLLDPDAFMAQIIGGLTAPIFNKRANKTRLEVAKTQQEIASSSFRNTLLKAGQEVNNAMNDYAHALQKISLREQQLDALEKSVSYTRELLTYGSATYTEVLNAQQNRLSAQLSYVNDHLQKLTSVVSLYRALGGGWK